MSTAQNGASSEQSSPPADPSCDAVATPQAEGRMDTLFEEELKRHKLSDVIRLLEDYEVYSLESFIFLGEEDFEALKTKGLKPFQKSQLQVIQKQLQEEKEREGHSMVMENSGDSKGNKQIGVYNKTVNKHDSGSGRDKATQTQPFEVTGQRYADRAFLVKLQDSLGKHMKKKTIKKICQIYIKNAGDENLLKKLQRQKADTLFRVMEERQDLKCDDVVFLQVLLWLADQEDLFRCVADESRQWWENYKKNIMHLCKAYFESGPTLMKFHLHMDISKFGTEEQEQLKVEIGTLLQVTTKYLEIVELKPDQSFWVIMKAPAVLCEALYRTFDRRATHKALEALNIDKVTFYTITDSHEEETRHVRDTAPRPSTSSASLQHGSVDAVTEMEEKKLPGAEDLERFDSYYGRKGNIYVFPGPTELAVRDVETVTKWRYSSDASISVSSITSYGIGEVDLPHEPFKGKSQALEKKAEVVVIERTKTALEEIMSPDDPPVFLFHNQHLCKTRKAAIAVLVLHPTLGVLVLEVEDTSTEPFPLFGDITTQLLLAQKDIQEEMGDLLEKNAVVMTIALPNLQPEDADVIRKKIEEERLEVHPEIRFVCGSSAEIYKDWISQLRLDRASSGHAFKGSSVEERADNFRRGCARLMEPKEFMTDVDTGNSEEYSSGSNTPSQSQASPPPDHICGNGSFQTSNPVREDPEGMEEQGGSSLSPPLDPLPSSMETLTSEISMLALQSPSIPTDQPPLPHPHLEQEPDSDPDSSKMELSGSGSNSVAPWRINSLEEDSCTAVDLSKLPAELKEEFFDGVIIHHEDDLQLAERVKKELVSLEFKNGLTPKIALENECTSMGRTEVYNFGKWFSKATWIFLLITHRFCHPDSVSESYKTAVSLTESCLYPIEKKNFVVPIFILNKKCDPIVPACLRVLSGVNCNYSGSMTDEDKSIMKRTLGSRIQERQMKEIEQKIKQTDFLQRKKELEL